MRKTKKPKRNVGDDKHKFMLRVPSDFHKLMNDLRHEKKVDSLQDIYNLAVKQFLQSNKKV